ncbi:MAG: hypothetical protein SGILL_006968 [Bacillariaceae sp.]
MNDRDEIPAVPKRQQSHPDLIDNDEDAYKDTVTITRDTLIRYGGIEVSNPLLKRNDAQLGVSQPASQMKAHKVSSSQSKPPKVRQSRRRLKDYRRKSSSNLAKNQWSSLPTIAEGKASLFEKESVSKSTPSLNTKGAHSTMINWNSNESRSIVPKQDTVGNSINFQFVKGKARSSLPSQGTTLFLLQDLHLSEKKRHSLKSTLQGTISAIDTRQYKPRGDFILSPPARISSNALLDVPLVDDTSSSTLSTPSPYSSPEQRSQDRFKSIISASPKASSPAKDVRMHSPKLPARTFSPKQIMKKPSAGKHPR